jgi:hypothetical protein
MILVERLDIRGPRRAKTLRYQAEHRVVVSNAIGRPLTSNEFVWHINRDMNDNRLENLYVFRSASAMARAIGFHDYPLESNVHELAAEAAVLPGKGMNYG